MLNFKGYQIEIELKDGKRITGTLKQVSPKSLTLTDAVFQDGGVSPVFKIKADKLYDLKVLKLPPNA
nr:Chain C, KLLA0A11308p [Kluyveromyces lactis NRRL Y-1140]6AM0_D Chain D, KLLA0A11308p [Kluyveromyces lactis NRRL Y-1140]6AM0_H Chain H, KLLA0A11308p [Kluyveromyces lactis NRRL Y-1140]